MGVDSLYIDPVVEKSGCFPDADAVVIESNNSKMFGVFYTAAGSEKHPTMLLLHGFPGTERNLDLAHAFRRAGWNTMVFHYRGSWGSYGDFSFQNVLDDVKAALKFVRSEEVSRKYRIDTKKIALVGHSMGGFATLLTAADDDDICACVAMAPFDFGAMGCRAKENSETMAFLQNMFKECIVPLRGNTVEALINEAKANGDKWSFVNNSEKLLNHKLLLISASKDVLAVPELHYHPLVDAMLSNNADKFEYKMIDTDHSFQDTRILLSETIESWLEKQI